MAVMVGRGKVCCVVLSSAGASFGSLGLIWYVEVSSVRDRYGEAARVRQVMVA